MFSLWGLLLGSLQSAVYDICPRAQTNFLFRSVRFSVQTRCDWWVVRPIQYPGRLKKNLPDVWIREEMISPLPRAPAIQIKHNSLINRLNSRFRVLDPDPGSGNLDPGSCDAGPWILDPGPRPWILSSGFWILDPGPWIWEAGSWALDPSNC